MLRNGQFLSLVAVQLVGCASILGIDEVGFRPDLDGGTRTGAPTFDAGTSDGAIASEASAEARAGEAGTWCEQRAPRPLFCDDFDEGSLGGSWTLSASNRGHFALDTSSSTSAPNSLVASSDAIADMAHANVERYKDLGLNPHEQICSFDFRADRTGTDPSHYIPFAGAKLTDGASWYAVWIALGSDGISWFLFEDSSAGPVKGTPFTPPPSGSWTRVKLDVVLTGTPHVSVFYDETTMAISTPFARDPPAKGTASVYLASNVFGPSESTLLRFDNVVCDLVR